MIPILAVRTSTVGLHEAEAKASWAGVRRMEAGAKHWCKYRNKYGMLAGPFFNKGSGAGQSR